MALYHVDVRHTDGREETVTLEARNEVAAINAAHEAVPATSAVLHVELESTPMHAEQSYSVLWAGHDGTHRRATTNITAGSQAEAEAIAQQRVASGEMKGVVEVVRDEPPLTDPVATQGVTLTESLAAIKEHDAASDTYVGMSRGDQPELSEQELRDAHDRAADLPAGDTAELAWWERNDPQTEAVREQYYAEQAAAEATEAPATDFSWGPAGEPRNWDAQEQAWVTDPTWDGVNRIDDELAEACDDAREAALAASDPGFGTSTGRAAAHDGPSRVDAGQHWGISPARQGDTRDDSHVFVRD